MTDDRPGLLTEREQNVLTGQWSSESDDTVSRDELLDHLSNCIPAVLADLELLYLCLTEEELRRIFTGRGDGRAVSIRATAQYVIALMYYGLVLTGDDVEYRVTSAIKQAEADCGMHATVELNILTEPFLPPDQRLAALKDDGFTRVSFEAFDRLFYDERVSAEELAVAASAIDEEGLTAENIRKMREAATHFERVPTPIVTSVQTVPDDGDN